MKKVSGFFKSFWFCSVLGAFLSFLMVFLLASQPLFAFQQGPSQIPLSIPAWIPTELPSAPIPSPEPQIASAQVSPDQDSTLTSPSGKVTLNVPKGAVTALTNIEFAEYAPEASTGMQMINRFDLNASLVASSKSVTTFSKNLPITIKHSADELAGVDINTLRLYYLDEKKQTWVPLTDSKFDPNTLTLTASTNHFSHYGEQAAPTIVGPGKVMAAQVSMYSGAATFDYPIELPPGPSGFTPKLELNYNSSSVNEMKNKQSMGSWVGIGWSLTFGSISYNSESKSYTLDFIDGSYPLFTNDGTSYHTKPETYFNITRSGDTWALLDRDGIYYRFGGTADSQQYGDLSGLGGVPVNFYRWDLSLIRDNNNNEATISYIQDTWDGRWVEAAYPEYLDYGNIHVHFTSSWDQSLCGTHQRFDGPAFADGNGTISSFPLHLETRELDSIEISAGSSLIRKYAFDYGSTSRVFSQDYGGIYYSGDLTLASIIQVGADGTSQLPAMTFAYTDLQIYRNAAGDHYVGNPGNSASLNWPFLTQINSGYGGAISYTYTQIPNTTYSDIWTREVVTTKTGDSGIGTAQTTSYTYTGNPQYLWLGWSQQFRGFAQVTETDSAGNYIVHFFYTTGNVNSNDAEKLTGKEYKTQWYSSTNTLLRQVDNIWAWTVTSQTTPGTLVIGGSTDQYPIAIAASIDNHLYTVTSNPNSNTVRNQDLNSGACTALWDINQSPKAMTVSSGNYVYTVHVLNGNGTFITEYTSTGYGVDFFDLGSLNLNITGIAVSPDNYIYVTKSGTTNVLKLDSSGAQVGSWSTGSSPTGIAISSDNYIYLTVSGAGSNKYVKKYDPSGNLITSWQTGTSPVGIAISQDNYIYVLTSSTVKVYSPTGTLINSWTCAANAKGIAITSNDYTYIITQDQYGSCGLYEYTAMKTDYAVQLSQTDVTTGGKTSRTRYVYDSYGNVVTQYNDGDTSTTADDSTVWTAFYPNTTANILDKPARQRTYATIMSSDSGGSNLKAETLNYYDGNNTSLTTPPTQGNLTRQQQGIDASNSVSSYFTYDIYGNMLTSQDGNGNTTTWTYETTYNVYPATKSYPTTPNPILSTGCRRVILSTPARTTCSPKPMSTARQRTTSTTPSSARPRPSSREIRRAARASRTSTTTGALSISRISRPSPG